MRGAVHRILCIRRKLLETCRLRVRFCPAGIGRRLQRGGKQQKRRLAKSLTGHDCRDRHNSIGADYAESVHNSGYKDRGFAVIGVSFDEEGWEVVRPFLEEQKVNYPVVLGDEELSARYDITALPKTLLIDREVEIALSHVGLVDKAEFEKQIRTLLR